MPNTVDCVEYILKIKLLWFPNTDENWLDWKDIVDKKRLLFVLKLHPKFVDCTINKLDK